MKRAVCMLALAVIFSASISFAAGVPPVIDIQGQLTDGGGNPYPDGVYTMAFKISFDTSGAGVPLWTETQSIKVEGGLFTAVLGQQTALSSTVFTTGPTRFLIITVGAEPPLPSIRLNSSAYSIQSLTADNATLALNLTCVGCVGAGEIASGAVGSAEVADNSLTSDDLAPGSVGNSEIAAGAVSTISISDGAILSVDLSDNSVTAAKIATNAVGSDEIVTGAVGSSEIALDAVDGNRIEDGSIGAADLGLFSVTTSKISPNAVGASKISDEPGVAAAMSLPVQYVVGTGVDVIDSWTIDAPAAGYILLIATGIFGTLDNLTLSMSTEPAVMDDSRSWILTGNGTFPLTMHALFPTDGGQETFYLLATMSAQNDTAIVLNLQFTMVYFPTAYGIVQTPAPGAGALDIANLRAPDQSPTVGADAAASAVRTPIDRERRIVELETRVKALESRLLKQ